jgi:MOSC domain-containing protein YiiM
MARIHQVNTSDGGVPKRAIQSGLVTATGIVGDRQATPQVHGGPTRALCLFALEEIEAFRAEGHTIAPGSAGENVTTEGLDWTTMKPGVRLRLGNEVEVEVTTYATPCSAQKQWFTDGDIRRLSEKLNPGHARAYTRVLRTGTIRTGDPIEVLAAAAEYERSIPVLRVADVDAAVDHYVAALGFAEVFRAGEPSEYARISKGNAVIDLGRQDAGSNVQFVVSDVDTVATELAASGARIVSGPVTTPWGRVLEVEDMDGNRLTYTTEG